LDAGPVLLRRSVFLTGGRTRGCKAISGVVGRSNPTDLPIVVEIVDTEAKVKEFLFLTGNGYRHAILDLHLALFC
jgi:hypothetical protein